MLRTVERRDDMEAKHETWDVQNKGTLGTRSARHEVVVGLNIDGSKTLPTVCKMPDLSEKSYRRARLIAAAPTMRGKLADTVAWLDREIEYHEAAQGGWTGVNEVEWATVHKNTADRLTELRDGLAKTLRKIEEGTA